MPEFTFPYSKLPLELRLQLWTVAAEEPMVVIIDLDCPATQLQSSSPPPAILHVCRESREVALKHYTLAFGSPRRLARLYFNFDRDILFLHRGGRTNTPQTYIYNDLDMQDVPIDIFDCNDAWRVQNLGFDLSAINDNTIPFHWGYTPVSRSLKHFYRGLGEWPSLKRLYLGFQHPELDLKTQISCVPLEERDYGEFEKAYAKLYTFANFRAPLPLSQPARIEWIRTRGCYFWRFTDEARSRYLKVKESVRLVKMVNL